MYCHNTVTKELPFEYEEFIVHTTVYKCVTSCHYFLSHYIEDEDGQFKPSHESITRALYNDHTQHIDDIMVQHPIISDSVFTTLTDKEDL